MYNEKVMQIFSNPKHVGEMKNASGVGMVGNEVCGDIMKLYIKVNEKEEIVDASFKTFGCAAAIVSSSVACDLIIGKTIEEALKLKNSDIIEYIGELPSQKIHCSMLAKEALEEAVKDYRKKQEKLAKKEAEVKTEKQAKQTKNADKKEEKIDTKADKKATLSKLSSITNKLKDNKEKKEDKKTNKLKDLSNKIKNLKK